MKLLEFVGRSRDRRRRHAGGISEAKVCVEARDAREVNKCTLAIRPPPVDPLHFLNILVDLLLQFFAPKLADQFT